MQQASDRPSWGATWSSRSGGTPLAGPRARRVPPQREANASDADRSGTEPWAICYISPRSAGLV
jgi:hypothetical protein